MNGIVEGKSAGGTLLAIIVGGMALSLYWGCIDSPEEKIVVEEEDSATDTGTDIEADTGTDIVVDTGDSGVLEDTATDTGTEQEEEYDCSAIEANENWELCDATTTSCAAVFYDAAGCHEVCAAVGLGCSEIWDNVDGECLPNTENGDLGCDALTGHESDYCICSGPPTETPEETSATAPYEDLLDERAGFGAGTTGGLGGEVCTVTTTSNSGPGSLRKCIDDATGATWVRFSVDGDIQLSSNISLPSNITVDARGRYIRIFGGGLTLHNGSNVIITNLIFKEGNGGDDNDAIQVRGSDKVWIHHCSFSNYGDGLVDLTQGTGDVTVSWSKFSFHDKVMLISADDNDIQDESTRVTLHHNWFRETRQRHPRLRHGKVHAFNNYFEKWGSYGMGCSTNSECYSEYNVFEAGTKTEAIITHVGEDEGNGEVESHNDLFLNGAMADENGSVFEPSDFYTYSADSTTGLSNIIEASAGAQ